MHQGFWQTLDQAWEQVLSQVRPELAKGGQLWVTGHSLGGALAVLAAARLSGESMAPSAVYTFGAPRVGDSDFGRAYPAPLYRVENGNDIVCHVPPPPAVVNALRPLLEGWITAKLNWSVPADTAYEHAGELTFIDWTGRLCSGASADGWNSPTSMRAFRLLLAAANHRASLIEDHRMSRYVERLAEACKAASGD